MRIKIKGTLTILAGVIGYGLRHNILLHLDPSSRRRSFLEKKRKIEKGPEKSAYYDKLV